MSATRMRRLLRSPVAWIALVFLTLIISGAILGPSLSQWDSEAMDFAAMQSAPSSVHWFGTDLVGRDQFVRTMLGARVSLSVALIAISVSLLIGIPWGIAAALAGGRWDQLMMRIVDILYGLPVILIVILLVVIFGRNQYLLFAALGAFFWLDIARIVRGQTLRLREAAFIQAARMLGSGPLYTLRHHILPNIAGPVIVYATLAIPGIILAESFISFLGLGVQEPDTSWGVLVADGAQTLESAPWLLLYPGLCLGVTIWSFNTLGDRLRDTLDNVDNRAPD
ncbi:MAG: ABC transporter permease [Pseudomonadota bacterium]